MANNQVVIEFVGDTKGLEKALDAIEKINKGLANMPDANAKFKKMNDEVAKLNKTVSEQQTQLAKLTKANEELMKSIAEGALTEMAKDLLDAAKATQTVEDRLKKLKSELSEMAAKGEEGTEKFRKMSAEAAVLEGAISDVGERVKALAWDTQSLDSLITIGEGVSQSFSVLQSYMELAGIKSKEFTEITQKVNNALSIMQGLQKLAALQTNLATAAESKNIIVKYAATAAQRALNLVMSLSPVFLLITGVTALVGILKVFSESSETAAEKQTKLNDANLVYWETLKNVIDLQRQENSLRTKEMENSIKLSKSKGASQKELLDMEIALAEQRNKDANNLKNSNGAYFTNEKEKIAYLEIITELTTKLGSLNEAIAKEGKEGDEERIKALEENKKLVESQLKSMKAEYDLYMQLQQDVKDTETEWLALKAQKNKLANERNLADLKAMYDNAFLLAKGNLEKEEEARLQSLAIERKQALANVDLTNNQRKLLITQYQQQEERIKQEYARRALENAQQIIDLQLKTVEEGSNAELQLRKQSIQTQRDIELTAIGLTSEQKKLIVEAALKEEQRLTEEYAYNTAISKLNAEVSYQQVKLAQAEENSEAMLKIEQDLVDAQMQMDILHAQQSIANETELQAKIKEIQANAAKQKEDLAREHQRKLHDIRSKELDANVAHEIAKLELVKNNLKLSQAERDKAADEILQKELLHIRKQRDQLDSAYDKKLISFEDYLIQRRALDDKYKATELEAENKQYEKKKNQEDEWREFYFNSVQTVMDTAFTIMNQQRQTQHQETMDAIAEQRDAAMEALEEKKEAGLVSEEQYQARKKAIEDRYKAQERQAKTKAAEADKQAAIFQALINTAVAITKAIPNPIAMAAAGIAGAAQVAVIAAKPIPKFAKGTKDAPEGFKWVGEQGPELIWTPGGERILTNRDSLALMEKYRIPALASHVTTPQLPLISKQVVADYERNATAGAMPIFNIDYDLLATKMGREMEKHPRTVITIDKGGFSSALISKGKRINNLNNRMQS